MTEESRFQRKVKVTIEPKKALGKKTIVVENLRVKFNVSKTLDAAASSAEIQIFNLSKDSRLAVAFRFNLDERGAGQDPFGGDIIIEAGYGDTTKIIFSGKITAASSSRQGGDYITSISAQTAAELLSTKKVSKSFPKGTPYITIMNFLLKELGETNPKAEVKAYLTQILSKTVLKSGESFQGNVVRMVEQINMRFREKIFITIDDSGVRVWPPGVSASVTPDFFYSKYTGLIGAPEITNRGINLKVLLEPNAKTSNLVFVDSPTVLGANRSDYFYAVRQVNHVGDNREGEFATSLVCWHPQYAAQVTPA